VAEEERKMPRFPLTPSVPVDMYTPLCAAQSCTACRHVLRMPNVLFSRQSRLAIVWIPKCACSTMRWLYLEWQRRVNPCAFQISHVGISFHELHLKKSFQFGFYHPDYCVPPNVHVLVVVRHPFRRFLSHFLQKYVLERDVKFMSTVNVRRMRMVMDAANEPITMRTVLMYMQEHGCLDIHDAPFTCQIPTAFLQAQHLRILDSDDPAFARQVRASCQHLRHADAKLLAALPRLNTTPVLAASKQHDMADVAHVIAHAIAHANTPFWDWTLSEWRERHAQKRIPDARTCHDMWNRCADPNVRGAFEAIYRHDLHFLERTDVSSNHCTWSSNMGQN